VTRNFRAVSVYTLKTAAVQRTLYLRRSTVQRIRLKKNRRVYLYWRSKLSNESIAITLVSFHCISAQSFVLSAFPACRCHQGHIKRRYDADEGHSHLGRMVQYFGKSNLYTQGYYVRKLPLNNVRDCSF
jgi:hypothetical protein